MHLSYGFDSVTAEYATVQHFRKSNDDLLCYPCSRPTYNDSALWDHEVGGVRLRRSRISNMKLSICQDLVQDTCSLTALREGDSNIFGPSRYSLVPVFRHSSGYPAQSRCQHVAYLNSIEDSATFSMATDEEVPRLGTSGFPNLTDGA